MKGCVVWRKGKREDGGTCFSRHETSIGIGIGSWKVLLSSSEKRSHWWTCRGNGFSLWKGGKKWITVSHGFVYYESIKCELKRRPTYECRCD